MSLNKRRLSLSLLIFSVLISPLLAGAGGRNVMVSSSSELRSAILNAQDNDNIIIANGSYTNGRPLIINNADDVVIRSASGDAQSVLLTGRTSFSQGGSYDELDDILRVQNCDRLLIENVTFTEAHGYGIKLELDNVSNPNDVHIADCRFIDIGTRHIKGTQDPNDTSKRILGGSVRRCYFKNTVTPPASGGWFANGNYIAGIDVMSVKNWVFEENEFHDLHGRTGEGRSAIFVWRSSENVTIQRNTIINCDRGITLGLSDTESVPHVDGAVVRNNSIKVKAVSGFTADSGIELWTVSDAKIYNNTIWREDNPNGRGIRFINGIENAEVVNNLVRGGLRLENGTTLARNENNIFRDISPGYFLNTVTGDLRLTTSAVDAIDTGVALAEVTGDHAGNPRDATPNIGAYESNVNPTLDTEAPSQPGNFQAVALAGNQARLTWSASTDNISVSGYHIYRNGNLLDSISGTQFIDQNLVTDSSYRYYIQAYDTAGNVSSNSPEITLIAIAGVSNVRDYYLNSLPQIDSTMKARLREIKLRGDSLGRDAGVLGQWGDSITNSVAYLGVIGTNGITTPPSSGHDYEPILIWMKASQRSDGTVGGNDRSSPLWDFKGADYSNASGWDVSQGLGAIQGAISLANPSWSLTMYGTNDVRRGNWSPEVYENRLRDFLQINIDQGVIPVISTIPPMVNFGDEVDQANTVITNVANSMNLPLVDLYGLYTTLHPDDWNGTVISSDGVHPSANSLSDLSDTLLRDSGYHVRTLLTLEVAEKIKSIVFDNGAPDGPNYPILIVESPTHPNQELTFNSSPQFTITHDSGVTPTGFSYVLDDQADTLPDTISEGSDTTISFSNQGSGVKYFHIRSNSSEGWSPAVHFEIRITDQPITLLQYKDQQTSDERFRDTYVSGLWGGDDNFGGANSLRLYNDDSTERARGLLYFDISSYTAPVPRAELVLSLTESADRDFRYLLYANEGDWVEGIGTYNNSNNSGVFYNNAPTLSSTTYGEGTVLEDATEVRIDVTELVNLWITGNIPNHGFAFRHREKYSELRIASKENGLEDKRPALIIWNDEPTTGTPAPSAPAQLSAQVIAGTQMSLSWVLPLDSPSQAIIYHIYRNQEATPIATPATTSFIDSDIQTNGIYTYQVSAIDSEGNESSLSAPVTRTVLSEENIPTGLPSPWMKIFSHNAPSAGFAWTTEMQTYYAVESSVDMKDWVQTGISRSGSDLMEQAALTELLGNPLPDNAFVRLHSYTAESTADEDNDGIPTWWEIRYSTGYHISNASANSDTDSLSNLLEFQNGTDPTKADTDGDGTDDAAELAAGTDPLVP